MAYSTIKHVCSQSNPWLSYCGEFARCIKRYQRTCRARGPKSGVSGARSLEMGVTVPLQTRADNGSHFITYDPREPSVN